MHEVKKTAKKEMPMTIDENKQASMTIKEREGISHTPLYGISPVSRGFSQTLRSTCRNIYRVCAKYVQSLLEVMGPVPLGVPYYRRTFHRGTALSPG